MCVAVLRFFFFNIRNSRHRRKYVFLLPLAHEKQNSDDVPSRSGLRRFFFFRRSAVRTSRYTSDGRRGCFFVLFIIIIITIFLFQIARDRIPLLYDTIIFDFTANRTRISCVPVLEHGA